MTHGYAVYERTQIHVDAGGGAQHRRDGDDGGAFNANAAVLFPLGRTLLVGPWLEANHPAASVNVAVVGRIPLLHDTGAVHVTTTMGWSSVGTWTTGIRVGPWIALTPTWALHLDLGGTLRGFDERALFATFGVTYLLGQR